MSNHPLTNHYNRLPVGAIEFPTDFSSENADVIAARQRAIDEGRLTVLRRGAGSGGEGQGSSTEEDDDETIEEDCLGCEAETPVFTSSDGTETTANNYLPPLTRYLGNKDGLDQGLILVLERVDCFAYPGSCHVVEEDCVENAPCSYDVTFTIGASIFSNPGVLPNITFNDPISFAPSTIVVTPSNVRYLGNTTTCEYVIECPHEDSEDAMVCGEAWTRDIDLETLAPTAADWVFIDNPPGPEQPTFTIRLACAECGAEEGDV